MVSCLKCTLPVNPRDRRLVSWSVGWSVSHNLLIGGRVVTLPIFYQSTCCSEENPCQLDEFYCDGGLCISDIYYCDGHYDCTGTGLVTSVSDPDPRICLYWTEDLMQMGKATMS